MKRQRRFRPLRTLRRRGAAALPEVPEKVAGGAMSPARRRRGIYLLPNAFTTASLFCGFFAIVQAMNGRFDIACVAKGGSLQGDTKVDVLCDEGKLEFFRSPRVDAPETHGAGCVFSAALAAYLAKGELMGEAVSKAKQFVVRALRAAPVVGHHRPLNLLGT